MSIILNDKTPVKLSGVYFRIYLNLLAGSVWVKGDKQWKSFPEVNFLEFTSEI